MLRTPARARRVLAGAIAVAIPAAILATASPASAYAPTPGAAEIMLEANTQTDLGANALANGWWGHETATHNKATFLSLNSSGTTLAAVLAKIGPDATAANLNVAYVVNPGIGNVRPTIAAGETAGQAYGWFDGSTFGSSYSGNTAQNDYVDTVSTDASYNAWVNAGSPVVGYDNNLTPIDAAVPGAPASGSHALGKSILNNWAAGTNIGLVFYVSNTTASNGEQVVLAGSDGKAEAAYVPLTTVALPADHSQDPTAGLPANYDTIRTSAGYIDTTVGDRTASTAVTSSPVSPAAQGASVTFRTTVTDTDNGNAPVTTGTVTFLDGATAIGTATPNASGVASLPVSTLSSGSHSITATYAGPITGLHLAGSTAAAEPFTVQGANTTTVVAVNPNTSNDTTTNVTLTAHSYKTGDAAQTTIPGTVTFIGHRSGSVTTTVLGSNIATDASGVASVVVNFSTADPSWTVEADFTPTNAVNYQASIDTSAPFAVTAPANPPQVVTGNVTADIPSGTMTLSTPYTSTNPLAVGTLTQNTDPTTGFSGSTTFSNIAIVDTLAGDLPWTLTAQSSNLTGGTTGTGVINAQDVGITGMTAAQAPTNGLAVFTPVPAASPAIEPGVTGTFGLAGLPAKTIAHTAHGVGSWNLGGTLTVNAPADTPAGHYAGTVTFTLTAQ